MNLDKGPYCCEYRLHCQEWWENGWIDRPEMLSAYTSAAHIQMHMTNFIIKANTMEPDQPTPL